ncbi:MAG TPA: hypothetical protein VKR22_01785 [Acidimicrobiales bacterium]|nr:hypothetical protein [Acidimicrobiales bacterium]
MVDGTVKRFDASKDHGFDRSSYPELIEGRRVQSEWEQGPKGPQAKSVRLA